MKAVAATPENSHGGNTKQQPTPYPLRMPPALREQLQQAAEASGRSVNAEILTRLQLSFGPLPPAERVDIADVVRTTIEELRAAESRS